MATDSKPEAKRPVGRPPLDMPPRIDASPEEIARAVLSVPFKKEWRYMKGKKK